MKDFDSERHARRSGEDVRTFRLGGETFVARAVIHPSVLTGYDLIDEKTPISETLSVIDYMILSMIEDTDGGHGRYLKVRGEKTVDPVTLEDLIELVKWLMETQTGRPTGPPSGSASGPNTTGTHLTAVSSSPATPQA